MSADSPRRNARGVPAIVPPQVVSDRSIIDSVAGFINDVTLAHQPQCDPKDTITWARFETAADISDSRFGDDWELEGNVAPPLLLILGYGQGVQVWAIPANGEAVEVLSWRHGIVSALRVLPTPSYAENGRADEPIDSYADKRPLMAICDGTTPAGSNPQFCAVNFVSLKTGAQVKTIKFKNPVLDILANRSSIVITFHERIAVFDARSLEDRLSVTTCFPSPGINPNPVALGTRWMAYSENKLLHSKRSGGGCDGDGVSSYTATVLNVAKSFGKGLRELGEQVAAGLTGTTGSGMSSKSSSFDSATGDVRQPGVVTILDIKHPIKDVSPTSGTPVSINGSDPIVAHFIAHSEAVVAMEFDNSGMMLLTADRRGHDFHLFRIQPHPVGSSLAAVHHLYVLHRGDTSAKVQNITFSLDSRWVAVSTLRGTTHVFPVTPYGGPAGVRTHTSLHVVNKLSRFHRSAGLTADGRSSSPISHSDSTNFSQMLMPYHNPTLPPFPRPTVVLPLAQLRQPFALGSPPGSAAPSSYAKGANTRQRLSSLSDDNGKPLSVCAVFAKSRSWLLDPPNAAREAPHKIQRKAVDSLFVMAGHGALIQYDLDTKLATNVAKEKICDDTPIELEVEAKAQWNLGRKDGSLEIMPPLSSDNWLIKDRNSCMLIDSTRQFDDSDDRCDSWLSQVEIITHAGPHRRLWMGPQFVFKTYNTPSGSNLSHIDVEAVEIGVSPGPSNTTCRPERSSPLNMPLSATGRSTVPVLIESGSYSSIEQSPKLMDRFRHEHMNSDYSVAHGDTRLKEDLADAMRESPSVSHKDTGGHPQRRRPSAAGSSRATASSSPSSSPKARSGGSGGVSSTSSSSSSAATLVGGGDGLASSSTSQYESFESLLQQQQQHMKTISIEKVVNPLGTVTTITGSCDSGLDSDDLMKGVSSQDYVIHENCDESLFRPVVAIFCDERSRLEAERLNEDNEYTKPPEVISNKLIVPVIEKAVDLELTKKESMKNRGRRQQQQQQQINLVKEVKEESDDEVVRFNHSDVNKKSKSDKKKQVKEEPVKKPICTQRLKASRSEEREDKVALKKPLVEGELTKPVSKRTKEFEDEVSTKKPSDSDLKLKSAKGRKKVEAEALSEDEPIMEKPSDRRESKKSSSVVENKHSDNDPKPKLSKVRKSVEKEALSDEESSMEKPSDKKESKKSSPVVEIKSSDNDSKTKLLKVRKSAERDPISEGEPIREKLSDKVTKPGNKSSVVDLKLKKEEELIKKTPKGRKSEEKDSEVLLKTASDNEPKPKIKESANEVPSMKLVRPLKTDYFEEEKPIEFKRMTVSSPVAAASTSKISNKGAKIDKIATTKVDIKLEEKIKPKPIEKKLKLEKGSSVESTDSVEIRGKSVKSDKTEKAPSAVSKGRGKSPEDDKSTDQVDGNNLSETTTSKKKAKGDEAKKKLSEAAKTAETTSLAVELSNVSDLADSLLDFLPEKNENEEPLPIDVDKLKKRTDDEEVVLDLETDQKSKLKPIKSTTVDKTIETPKCEITIKMDEPSATLSDKESKKLLKKTKPDKVDKADKAPTPLELMPELSKIEEPIDLVSKVSVNKKDTIITVEEKTADESESSDSSKNLLEISTNQLETKTKLKKKSKTEKTETKKPALMTTDIVKTDKPLSEPKSTQLIDIFSPDIPSTTAGMVPVEKKVRKDKLSRLLDLSAKTAKAEAPEESRKELKKDKSDEMTGSKITIEPLKVDTFLSDLMDSQKATKSKTSPTDSPKSEESPKKSAGSPLKFVDTYVDSFVTPEPPIKKEKTKKKTIPGKVEKLPDKLEASFSGRLKSSDGIQFFDKFLQESTAKAPAEPVTPWKSLSIVGDKVKSMDTDYPTLGKPIKTKKSQSPPAEKKEKSLTFTIDIPEEKKTKDKKSYKATTEIVDELPSLQPLEDLPIDFLAPLPPLEPLEGADENISLINFESPLQEAAKPLKSEIGIEKSSPQFPKGFPADTIIFALCGSLHYENENSAKPADSPLTLSFSDSTAHTTAEYKSLTENDDQYLSLEQSSQENAPSTSSSTCEDVTEAAYSSGGGAEKITIVSGKAKNKQRRKKQLITAAPDDDEELRPLISKNDDVNLMTCSLTTSKACTSDKAKVIMKKETLPPLDNNQVNSDSSSSDQATTSEDPDDQICLNVHTGDAAASATGKSTDKSAGDDADLTASIHAPQQVSQSQSQQQPNSSKKKLKRRKR